MATLQIYSNNFITVEYHQDHQYIQHIIHEPIGEAQVDIFREALIAGGDALKKYNLTKWLSDDRRNGPLPEEIVVWAQQHWYPDVIGAGWKYWANVVPNELQAAGTLQPVIETLHGYGLQMSVFTNIEEAHSWLISKG